MGLKLKDIETKLNQFSEKLNEIGEEVSNSLNEGFNSFDSTFNGCIQEVDNRVEAYVNKQAEKTIVDNSVSKEITGTDVVEGVSVENTTKPCIDTNKNTESSVLNESSLDEGVKLEKEV